MPFLIHVFPTQHPTKFWRGLCGLDQNFVCVVSFLHRVPVLLSYTIHLYDFTSTPVPQNITRTYRHSTPSWRSNRNKRAADRGSFFSFYIVSLDRLHHRQINYLVGCTVRQEAYTNVDTIGSGDIEDRESPEYFESQEALRTRT